MPLGPEERRKAKSIMRTMGVSYREALSIMSRAAVIKRAQKRAKSDLSKSIEKRRLKPPPSNLWYNRD